MEQRRTSAEQNPERYQQILSLFSVPCLTFCFLASGAITHCSMLSVKERKKSTIAVVILLLLCNEVMTLPSILNLWLRNNKTVGHFVSPCLVLYTVPVVAYVIVYYNFKSASCLRGRRRLGTNRTDIFKSTLCTYKRGSTHVDTMGMPTTLINL